jgi:predicted metal-dependent peptidase
VVDDPATRLSAARTRLVLDRPFLGALTLRLPLVAADPDWCRTTATDARAIYYNPDYIAALPGSTVEFVLAHEALHCALGHFQRRQHRVKQRWDVACDLAVNPLLAGEGLAPPPDALLLDEFAGMSAEEIYPCLDEDEQRETHDQHLYDSEGGEGGGERDPEPERDGAPNDPGEGQGQGADGRESGASDGAQPPASLSPAEAERLEQQWRQHLAGAAQAARQHGELSAAMARLVDRLLQPQLPWRTLLAQYLGTVARDDFSYQRPSRREGAAILPALRSHRLELVALVDTSGSIDDALLRGFVAELDALKSQLNARVTLHACDRELSPEGPWSSEPWEVLQLPDDLAGGGGTSFEPPFAWVAEAGLHPDLLVYFTDADGPFPAQPPGYPVLWVVQGPRTVPWGLRVQYQ